MHHSSSELYGSDRSLLSIVDESATRGLSIEVHLPNGGPLVEELSARGVFVQVGDEIVLRRQRLLRSGYDLVKGAVSLRLMKKGGNARLVLSNTSAVLTPALESRRGAPWVAIVREYFSSPLERRIFQGFLRRAAGIVCVSDSVRAQFDDKFLARMPNVVVHSGADLADYLSIDRSIPPTGQRELRILCIGRISEWKGQGLLLEALAMLSPEVGAVELRLVGGEFGGPGALTAELERRSASMPPHVSVELAGESRNVSDHYAWADIVVVPSRKPEPFGKVVIEGMAAGCLVVASNHGGPAEVIADRRTGLLFDAGSADDLARVIAEAAEDRSLVRRVSEAGRAAAPGWSADAAARKILDFAEGLRLGEGAK